MARKLNTWSPIMTAESAASFLREQAEKVEKHGGRIRLAYTPHYLDCDGKTCQKHGK